MRRARGGCLGCARAFLRGIVWVREDGAMGTRAGGAKAQEWGTNAMAQTPPREAEDGVRQVARYVGPKGGNALSAFDA